MPAPLSNAHTVTKLPAQDLERARAFYRDKLGLEPVEERTGGLRYVCGPTEFHLFSSAGEPSGESTQMGFEVQDLERRWRAAVGPSGGTLATVSEPRRELPVRLRVRERNVMAAG
jgi:catechol 2,3-dioxygenase-like lactoylglutathione lyase family enzyme